MKKSRSGSAISKRSSFKSPKRKTNITRSTVFNKPNSQIRHPLLSEEELINSIKIQDYEPVAFDYDEDLFFEISDRITSKNGWISPSGMFYDIRWQTHEKTGDFLADQLYGEASSIRLENEGWIRFSKNDVIKLKTSRRTFIPKQLDMFYDYMIEQNLPSLDFHIAEKLANGKMTRGWKGVKRQDLYEEYN